MKLQSGKGEGAQLLSLPSRERELKHGGIDEGKEVAASLPSRERELKLAEAEAAVAQQLSLPSRERELKRATFQT